MATVHTLGPADHGRAMTWDEFRAATWDDGYRYELIDGRLYVSPSADAPHDWVWEWIFTRLLLYSRRHPKVINYVTPNSRVFLPDDPEETQPQPDVAAYRDYPRARPPEELDWRENSPILVVEIVSADDPGKDLDRNVRLYERVPSIREYWILDPREDASRPSLRVYRRRGARWQKPIDIPFGGTYATKLLPDFTLSVDPAAGRAK